MTTKKEIPQKQNDEKDYISNGSNNFLTLHNDDIHSFDYVIESLIEICEHDFFQAEQCAFIVHYKGKCDIKKGEFTALHPLKQKLVSKGLTVTIE
jgi:ATP-dependent Clp protease adaptor protein ClpS